MGAWETAIFSDDLAMDVRKEYNFLLSVGKNAEEIEVLFCSYYHQMLSPGSSDYCVLWLSLSLIEWNTGRLTQRTKEIALHIIESDMDLKFWADEKKGKRKEVLEALQKKLLSAMPSPVKIRKPKLKRCPWKVGSLLSYKIATNEEELSNHPCFNQYALLRVVQIDKTPISPFPPEYCNESLIVGVYGWIGKEIPDSAIVNKLDFVPIVPPILLPWSKAISSAPITLVQKMKDQISIGWNRYCENLSWDPPKGKEQVLSLVSEDPDFLNHRPEVFRKIVCKSYSHFYSFDISLAKVLLPYCKTGDGLREPGQKV